MAALGHYQRPISKWLTRGYLALLVAAAGGVASASSVVAVVSRAPYNSCSFG
jgi:hypothetical protein